MEYTTFLSDCKRIFAANPTVVQPTEAQMQQLFALTERMLQVNAHMNLTAITEPSAVIWKHYVDSLTVAGNLPEGAKIADIGCGAGFPSLPLAICRPDLQITAIDATAKRIAYIQDTAAMLSLTNLTPIAMRAEDGAKRADMREQFDVVTARAVAALPVLAELCLPYVRVGGSFIAMKSSKAKEEMLAAQNAIALCGGEAAQLLSLTLTDGVLQEPRCLVLSKKIQATPKKYPRNFSQISKKPL